MTKRVPLHRRHAPNQISPEAVAIYRQLRRLRCECGPPLDGRTAASLQDECVACRRWWRLHGELDAALGPSKPWLWPHLVEPTLLRDRNGILRRRQALKHQRELAATLREAARAARPKRITNGDAAADRGTASSDPASRPPSTRPNP